MKCKYCNNKIATYQDETLLCDNCWEIEKLISVNILIVKKIIKVLEAQNENNKN